MTTPSEMKPLISPGLLRALRLSPTAAYAAAEVSRSGVSDCTPVQRSEAQRKIE